MRLSIAKLFSANRSMQLQLNQFHYWFWRTQKLIHLLTDFSLFLSPIRNSFFDLIFLKGFQSVWTVFGANQIKSCKHTLIKIQINFAYPLQEHSFLLNFLKEWSWSFRTQKKYLNHQLESSLKFFSFSKFLIWSSDQTCHIEKLRWPGRYGQRLQGNFRLI